MLFKMTLKKSTSCVAIFLAKRKQFLVVVEEVSLISFIVFLRLCQQQESISKNDFSLYWNLKPLDYDNLIFRILLSTIAAIFAAKNYLQHNDRDSNKTPHLKLIARILKIWHCSQELLFLATAVWPDSSMTPSVFNDKIRLDRRQVPTINTNPIVRSGNGQMSIHDVSMICSDLYWIKICFW